MTLKATRMSNNFNKGLLMDNEDLNDLRVTKCYWVNDYLQLWNEKILKLNIHLKGVPLQIQWKQYLNVS